MIGFPCKDRFVAWPTCHRTSGARAEAHLVDLWRTTFTSAAAVQEAWLERAFVRRGRAIVETIYPDAAERRRLYQYGFSPLVGRRFEEIAPRVRELIAAATSYGEDDTEARIDVFEGIGELLAADRGFGFRVRQTDTDQALLRTWANVLGWWMHEPESVAPEAVQLTGTNGRRQRYSVIPVENGAVIRWLDPAGFELARSDDILGEFPTRNIGNDYELRIGRRETAVHRTFSAASRP